MTLLPGVTAEIQMFLSFLGSMVSLRRNFEPSPTEVQNIEWSGEQLRRLVPQSLGYGSLADQTFRLGELLLHEPSTWGQVSGTKESWVARPTAAVGLYDGVRDVNDYAEKLVAEISPPRPQPIPAVVSSLAVPEAIDYLNVVWRERARQPLFSFRKVEAAAKIAFECESADEFESRVSALCDVLSHLKLPGGNREAKLSELETYLEGQLPAEGLTRAIEAVKELRSLFDIRAWRQHSGGESERRARRAMRTLQLQLPAADWGAAWRRAQSVTVAALNGLREEVERVDTLPPAEEPASGGQASVTPGEPQG